MNLYEIVIRELLDQKVQYLIIGSYARLWNNISDTLPKDLDIWITPNLRGKIVIINGREALLNKERIIEIQKGMLKLNIFLVVHGLDFDSSFTHSNKKTLKDKSILNFINKKDCLTNLTKVKELWDF